MYERELLGSQTTHRNEPVLFGITLPWRFQKVQAHFCGMSVSRAIRDWNWSILSKIWNSWKWKNWEIHEIFKFLSQRLFYSWQLIFEAPLFHGCYLNLEMFVDMYFACYFSCVSLLLTYCFSHLVQVKFSHVPPPEESQHMCHHQRKVSTRPTNRGKLAHCSATRGKLAHISPPE